jgi:hypothetical protein
VLFLIKGMERVGVRCNCGPRILGFIGVSLNWHILELRLSLPLRRAVLIAIPAPAAAATVWTIMVAMLMAASRLRGR